MVLRLFTGIALALLLGFFFFDLVVLKIAAVVAIGGCFFLSFLYRFAKKETSDDSIAESSRWEAEREELNNRIAELNRRLSEQQEKYNNRDDEVREIYRNVLMFAEKVPVAEKLIGIVIKKSESSTERVTTSIFSVAETSKKVGLRIQELLTGLFEGEKSLQTVVTRLSREIDGMHNLIRAFQQISNDYHEDMSSIEKNVQNIEQFTDSITDLADKTNLLAINASIEAARVGAHGKGFAVIAGEVQELSSNSKKLAEQINEVIQNTAGTVNTSFTTLSTHIENAVNAIQGSQKTLDEISTFLSEQLQAIEGSVEESKKLSGSVTEGLNEVIYSQQYQDITRQVLEHLVGIFTEAKEECEQVLNKTVIDVEINQEEMENVIKEIARRHFTVKEEWDALGLELEESLEPVDTQNGDKEEQELKGDVTLF